MFSLNGKVAVITGAGSGIGESIAVRFAEAGAIVYVAELNPTAGEQVAARIRDTGGQAHFIAVDVSQESSCRQVGQQVLSTHDHRCDILVNNAGIGHVGTALTTTGADLDRMYAVNVKGVLFMSQAFLPSMIARRWGSIINLASIGGIVAVRDRLAYCATKFAVVGLTKCMALDHADSQVRVNCICPGRVETPFVQQRLKEYPDPKKAYEQMAATQALGRMGKPDEIAAAALYLAADESAFVTGSSLIIDGGWSAGK
ncbi:MAG TPA: glucose 1-dehydrogenase [Tepidisphaeraceae bacterium]|nr:glucose 1-dehydrogenase [Tepidisphaeraceae bacterium]